MHEDQSAKVTTPWGEIILAGDGHQNGFLFREIQRRLPETELVALGSYGIPADFLRATATAVLGLLHIDQIPANSPTLTGADSPRILGRLTPGNPANWHQVLACMAQTLPDKLPLRSAI